MGFDPRGIGQSTPIHCLSDTDQDRLFASDPKADNEAEFTQAITESQAFVDKCIAKTKSLKYFSTAAAAHDMELLRQGLGDPRLNYLGFSYGTYLGTLYAQQYPEKVGRFVLDGAIDPMISSQEQSLVQAVAFDQALANFITDCSSQGNCPLPSHATGRFFIELFSKVAAKPLTISQGKSIRVITEALVVTGTAAALYENESGWPKLRTAIEQALLGDGSGFAELADSYNGRKSDGTYGDNQNDANVVIDCLDSKSGQSNAAIRADAERFSRLAPVFGPYVASSGITCNLLNKALNRSQITSDPKAVQIQSTATPILIIGTTQDPATPYLWAQALSRYIKGSQLITFKGQGHTGYGRGSACLDDAVDAYLTRGEIPRKALICRQ